MRVGFDSQEYIKRQSEQIEKRISEYGKLYLEFGGKLFDDYHASRVLPGFAPDTKVRMLEKLKDVAEIVIVINAGDIESNRIRSDYNITYDTDVLRLIDAFRDRGLYVGSVVISQFAGEPAAAAFKKKLETFGITVYEHYPIADYPFNVELIVSADGYGKNEFVETTRPLVVVTAPGPSSGKMATCLSQLYHEHLRGVLAGYAKFETFPVWNIPLKHPVNMAYEAATADLRDINMIDPYHLEAYGISTVNYNRDVEVFPVLTAIFERIFGTSAYKSPTDMGVNMAGYAITDDEVVREAARHEIIRRYYAALAERRKGLGSPETVKRIEMVMKQVGVTSQDRKVIKAALDRSESTDGQPAVAIELPDGTIITGKTSPLLGASSAALLNAVKALANIDKPVHLIEPEVIEPIQRLKTQILGNKNPRLHTDEVLIALCISAVENDRAQLAVSMLPLLAGCQAHSTVILAQVDAGVYRKLGIQLTCEPKYQTQKLFHR